MTYRYCLQSPTVTMLTTGVIVSFLRCFPPCLPYFQQDATPLFTIHPARRKSFLTGALASFSLTAFFSPFHMATEGKCDNAKEEQHGSSTRSCENKTLA